MSLILVNVFAKEEVVVVAWDDNVVVDFEYDNNTAEDDHDVILTTKNVYVATVRDNRWCYCGVDAWLYQRQWLKLLLKH